VEGLVRAAAWRHADVLRRSDTASARLPGVQQNGQSPVKSYGPCFWQLFIAHLSVSHSQTVYPADRKQPYNFGTV
jgi:hypothetical protein